MKPVKVRMVELVVVSDDDGSLTVGSLRQSPLSLVRVLVASERLRAVELSLTVVTRKHSLLGTRVCGSVCALMMRRRR